VALDGPAEAHRQVACRIAERQDLAGLVLVLLEARANQEQEQEQEQTLRGHDGEFYDRRDRAPALVLLAREAHVGVILILRRFDQIEQGVP